MTATLPGTSRETLAAAERRSAELEKQIGQGPVGGLQSARQHGGIPSVAVWVRWAERPKAGIANHPGGDVEALRPRWTPA